MRKRVIYARILLTIMVLQVVSGVPAYALTGGPSQPEFQAFEPIGTTEMVNLPDGGFTYNIPLMDIGGYPLNLSYHSEITSDMEASCVGLGWTINPGVINRNVRALPDDFNGREDGVKKEYNIKPNRTIGASLSASFEVYGADVLKGMGSGTGMQLNLNMGMFRNNYWGVGYEFGLSSAFKAGSKGSGYLTAGMGTSMNSQSGANFSPSLGYSMLKENKDKTGKFGLNASASTQINSRHGLRTVQMSGDIDFERKLEKGKMKGREIVGGVESSAAFSYAGVTFTPEFTMPQLNESATISVKPTGVELFGSNTSFSVTGYFSQQGLWSPMEIKPAYGMLYAQKGYQNENALMDFNREKDGAFQDYSIHLPIVNPGYDVLSVNGQGIGGSFQLKRGDVPVFFDTKSIAGGFGESFGFETGQGNTAHGGADIKYNITTSDSKKWTRNNNLLNKYNFVSNAGEGYESAYYKAAGEMAVESDDKYFEYIGKDQPVTAVLKKGSKSFNVETREFLVTDRGATVKTPQNTAVTREKRERRNQVISHLTADEAAISGLEKSINTYEFSNGSRISVSRKGQYRRGHHISQIEAVQPGGMRYIYGIPAYNILQKEVTFSVAQSGVNCSEGVVVYNGAKDGDNSPKNKRGQDNYFSAVTTPAYAHSYLLTAVLGKDYEDRTGDGPTEDDFGSYTKINYARMRNPVTKDTVYHWRVPFGEQRANYNPGFYSKAHDDKGTYVYGQKEILYVYSIESKTMVAEFHYSERFDSYGVKDENGGFAAYNLNKKLDKIVLYAKPDRIKNGAKATPIKTVHFTYDYKLCPGTDNSKKDIKDNPNSGKLTLRSLYFTYGHSQKGKLSEYKFQYKNEGAKYSSKDYDRWGYYKAGVHQNLNCANPGKNDPLGSDEFPYSEQNENTANANAGTWSLNRIDLPSGGTIKVDYKAKHYAYVQDRPAMQMMNIAGVNSVNGDKLYSLTNPFQNTFKVFFFLKNQNTTPAELKRDYLRDIKFNDDHIYLKCLVKMNSGPLNNERWEYVSVYAQIASCGVEKHNGINYGYVNLVALPVKDDVNPIGNNINPITKFALQYMRENLPEIAYDQDPVDESSIRLNLGLFKPLAAMGKQFVDLVHGFNNVMIARGYAKEISLKRSWIRLYEPNGVKFGGGSMVSQIVIEDNWDKMTGDPNAGFRYGQEYDYTTETIRSDGSKDTISSGVAAYEPLIGGDENPWRKPHVLVEKRRFAADNVHFVEEPFGEVFMPAPQVVFGKVTVRNLQYGNVKRTATGHTVMKYYTARDFPVKPNRTNLQRLPERVSPILSLFKIKLKEHMNAAQGYLMETNNMHGQPMSSEVFDENGEKISGVHYYYKTKSSGVLDNEVDVIHADGSVKKGLLGIHYSLAGDARHSKSKTLSAGVAINMDAFQAGPVPVVVPIPWPDYEASEEQFQSVSFTKLIHKCGVLERVEAEDLGSRIATENLAWDAETGEVLLTRTYNEFKDPIYNLKLPAHFAYRGMQGAYQNIGFETNISPVSNGLGKLTSTTAANYFLPGDEVLLNGTTKAWVLHVNTANQQLYLIDINGQPLTPPAGKIKVTRSGYRNMPSTQIGSITSMENPIKGNTLVLNKDTKVLHAEAVEYSENWQSFCGPANNDAESNCFRKDIPINPFVRNVRGEWRPERSWLYLTERDRKPLPSSASNNSSTNIRDNGAYEAFNSFWQKPTSATGVLWRKDDKDWIWSALTTQTNPNGTELEAQNRLGLYSAEILGYYHQLITGVAANSRYRQIAFEGFEDFDYNAALLFPSMCPIPRHFGEGFNKARITNKTSHSGKYALEVPGSSKEVTINYKIWENCPGKIDIPAQRARTPFVLLDCECIQSFSPDPGKYVLTAWVKEGNGLGKRFYDQHKMEVFTSSGIAGVFRAAGPIIDGWQRVEGEFDIAKGDTHIRLELVALDKNTTVYFDDIRVFPFNGSMKNYVYDDISLKLLAELDANGYAKFYEYNQAGELIRVKQETERGIMTIQESNYSSPKK